LDMPTEQLIAATAENSRRFFNLAPEPH